LCEKLAGLGALKFLAHGDFYDGWQFTLTIDGANRADAKRFFSRDSHRRIMEACALRAPFAGSMISNSILPFVYPKSRGSRITCDATWSRSNHLEMLNADNRSGSD
jgi:hypothetical protein